MTSWSTREVPPNLAQRYIETGWWTDDTLGGLCSNALASHPDATVAVWSRQRPWKGTYADIDDEARRLITVLVAHGVRPGEVVAFQLPNWREALVAFAALAMGGYVLAPIVHIYGRKEVTFILEQCGAVAYISPASFGAVNYLDIVDHASPKTLRTHIVVGDIPGSVDGAESDVAGGSPVEQVPWSEVEAATPTIDLPVVASTSVSVLGYTSGTTSDPKGVIHDHRTLLSELRHMTRWTKPGRPNLMGSPITHATGMLGGVLGPFKSGSEIHVIDRWDPTHVLEIMLEASIGAGTGAAVFLSSILDHPGFTPAHAANMERIGLGGSPVPVALGEKAASHGILIIRAYGSTEHPSTTGGVYEDPADVRHGTDGRPLDAVEIKLVDADDNEVGVGVAGEILSRGPELCLGYTDAALNVAFDNDGWYRTGDIGIVDANGYLTITDRAKDIIIRGGENISAAEVEEALGGLPGLAEIAVVAAPDERLGEHGCAVIRMAPGFEAPTLDDLRARLTSIELAKPKWPEEIRVVTDFPRTASGKIRKVDLRRMLREGTL